jgi:DNA-directed RNA polymerase subunit RPC12/RpoP
MNTFCEFIKTDISTYKCIKCQNTIHTNDEYGDIPYVACRSVLLLKESNNDNQISIGDKIKNFVGSLYGHLSNGMETVPQEIINDRYKICKDCEFFKESTCTKCGCPLLRDRVFISKLAWASEKCPVGKWDKYQ